MKIIKVASIKSWLNVLLTFVLLESVLGGGGRLIEIGTLSLKMVLFVFALGISILFVNRWEKGVLLHVQIYLFIMFVVGIWLGVVIGADTSLIIMDIKPLSFFFIIPFFSLAIRGYDDVFYVVKIMRVGSLILAFSYFFLLFLLYRGFISFDRFYEWGNETGEVFFRGEGNYTFFFKGFLYLCIGFFFHLTTSKSIKGNLLALIMYISVCLTLSRGLILMTTLVLGFYIFFITKNKWLKFFSILSGIILVIYLLPVFFNSIGDKSEADSIRINTFKEVVERINLGTIFVGYGFGTGVPIRPEHMEISYLELFHKQGVIGLSFYAVILFFVLYYYFSIKCHKNIALAFVLSVCFVYLESFTNPFMNNPIGISIIALALVVLYRMYRLEKKDKI